MRHAVFFIFISAHCDPWKKRRAAECSEFNGGKVVTENVAVKTQLQTGRILLVLPYSHNSLTNGHVLPSPLSGPGNQCHLEALATMMLTKDAFK